MENLTVTRLPELPYASQRLLRFLIKSGKPFVRETARRVTRLAESLFFDFRESLLVDRPTFLHLNTCFDPQQGQRVKARQYHSMRERCRLGPKGPTFLLLEGDPYKRGLTLGRSCLH